MKKLPVEKTLQGEPRSSVAQRIVALLNQSDLSQKQFAKKVGVSANTLKPQLGGAQEAIPERWLRSYASFFGVTYEYLLNGAPSGVSVTPVRAHTRRLKKKMGTPAPLFTREQVDTLRSAMSILQSLIQ